MTTYQVLSWRGIPAQVKATDESGRAVTQQLPPSFQQEIDRVAMAEGLIDSDAYLEAWAWSEPVERDGTADEVAAALVIELEAEWERSRSRDTG